MLAFALTIKSRRLLEEDKIGKGELEIVFGTIKTETACKALTQKVVANFASRACPMLSSIFTTPLQTPQYKKQRQTKADFIASKMSHLENIMFSLNFLKVTHDLPR